eukprot:COSAG02_NODE_25127_length_668_cov_1.087873_1_plen_185_part_10
MILVAYRRAVPAHAIARRRAVRLRQRPVGDGRSAGAFATASPGPMLRLLPAVAVLLVLAAMLPVAGGTQAAVGFWVATSGSDGNPGGANAPFRTIARAAEAVRVLPRPLHQTVTVHVAAGDYPLNETLQLSGAADSGSSAEARVDYVAEGGRVRVLGGRVVPHHALLTNTHELAQTLPAATRTID